MYTYTIIQKIILYGYVTWSLTLCDKPKLSACGIKCSEKFQVEAF